MFFLELQVYFVCFMRLLWWWLLLCMYNYSIGEFTLRKDLTASQPLFV